MSTIIPSPHTKIKKARGGVSCFLKDSLSGLIESVDLSCSNHILVRFNNGNIVFSSYIAPTDSPYCNPLEFSYVANAFSPVSDAIVFGGGDLNGRVGNMAQERPPMNGTYRTNCDEIINEHGKEIINICSSFDCYIVNNLNFAGKAFDGNFTFQKGSRKAQNDIL